MRIRILGVVVLALSAAVAQGQDTQTARATGVPVPELPVAEWGRNGSVALEDFRGQLTAVVFYNDKNG